MKIAAHLQIFKPTGKWYTNEDILVDADKPLFKIFEDVREMRDNGQLSGDTDYIIVIDVPEHQNRHPGMIVGESVSKTKEKFLEHRHIAPSGYVTRGLAKEID